MNAILPGLSDPFEPRSTTTSTRGTPSSSTTSSSSSPTSLSTSASSSSPVSSPVVPSTSSTSSTGSSIEGSTSSPIPLSVTRTTVVVESSSSVFSSPGAAASNTSFLQNKVASGFVFAIVGIFAVVFFIFITTFFIRRRKTRKLIEDAVSFDPVTVGHDDMEKAKQSSSLGHGSHDMKNPLVHNHYSPALLHSGGPHQVGYNPHTAAQLYVPPARYGSPLPPVPTTQHQHQQHHLSYISAMSSSEDAHYSRPISGEMRAPVRLMGGQVPEDIRRQYSTN